MPTPVDALPGITVNYNFPYPGAKSESKRLADIQATKAAIIAIDTKFSDLHRPAAYNLDGLMTAADKLKLDNIHGTNTGDQTTITGNAGTATKLETARNINGVPFDGSADITIDLSGAADKIGVSEKGVANGVATLDSSGKVPSAQLPSFVDDVLEFASTAAFPGTGETGKIYVALNTNKTYRWSGSAYIFITSGAVDSVAGKTGVVTLVKADVGLGNVDNTSDANKPVSTAQATAIATVQSQVTGLSTSKADLLLVKNRKTANYTLAVTDSGKNIYFEGAGSYILTVPKKTSVNIPQDTTITVINHSENAVTVTFQTGVSYYINGNPVLATANAVLSPRSILVLLKTEDDIWYASGVAFA